MHTVHPASISLEAHYKKRVVRKRDALLRALHTGGGTTITVVTTLLVPSSVSVGNSILLRPKRHGAPSAKGEVHDARAAHDVDRLVRVFRDVVRARAVELDEHVIYGVLERVLDVCANGGYCGREGEQRWRFIGRVAVDWVAFVSVRAGVRERVLAVGDRRRGAYYTVLTCHWRRSRLELQLVAELHHLWATLRDFDLRAMGMIRKS
jgi:hypothetical protein